MKININLIIMTFLAFFSLSFSKEMSVAFFNLKSNGLSEDKSNELSERFLSELYKTKGFKIITTKELWNLLQKEGVQKTTKFEDFDVNERSINSLEESNLVKFLAHSSMLLNIEAIIMGTLSMTDSNLYVSIKLIKSNDGQVITIANKECNPFNKDSLSQALMIVANEIAEPTGVLVYKELIEKDDFKKADVIITGFGRRNEEGFFNYDTSQGIWTVLVGGQLPVLKGTLWFNEVKWKTEYVYKNNVKYNNIQYYDENNILTSTISSYKDSNCVLNKQDQCYFGNGNIANKEEYRNGYLNNAVWLNTEGDTISFFNKDSSKYKFMNKYNTDTTYSKSGYGRVFYKDSDSGEMKNTDNYYKCYCCAVTRRDECWWTMRYESFRELILHGLFTSYYPNGAIKDSGLFVYGKKNGKWIAHYNNGKIKSITNWKNAIEDGDQIYYWENGNKRLKYYIKKGNKDGVEEEYYENGNKNSIIFRKNGEIEKPYYVFREDGKKAFYYSIYNGIKNGIDTAFYSFIESDWGSLNALYYLKNDEQIMERSFDINRDYSKCDVRICRFLNNIKDTIITNLRVKFQNGKYTRYKINLKTGDEKLIDNNDTLNKDDFKILLEAIEYNKKNYIK